MKYLIFAVITLLTACSSVSPAIQSSPAGDVQLKQVLSNIDSHQGATVRWGGKIIEVNNFETFSQLQIVQFPLNKYGRPVEADDSQGRFFVRSQAFLDPEIFKQGTMLTVFGKVIESATVTVDQKNLLVPVVEPIESHRWPTHSASGRPYNPKHDWPFIGYGYYGTGSYSP